MQEIMDHTILSLTRGIVICLPLKISSASKTRQVTKEKFPDQEPDVSQVSIVFSKSPYQAKLVKNHQQPD